MCLGIPVKVEKIEGKIAIASAGGAKRQIALDLLPGIKVGDYVLLHAGFAIQKIDAEEARQTLKLLEQLFKEEN